MSDQEVSDAVYMIEGLANCCDDGGIRDVDVLEQHEREEMAVAIRTVTKALAVITSERDSLLAALRGLCKAVSSEGVAGALAVHDLATWANVGEALSVAVAALTTTEV